MITYDNMYFYWCDTDPASQHSWPFQSRASSVQLQAPPVPKKQMPLRQKHQQGRWTMPVNWGKRLVAVRWTWGEPHSGHSPWDFPCLLRRQKKTYRKRCNSQRVALFFPFFVPGILGVTWDLRMATQGPLPWPQLFAKAVCWSPNWKSGRHNDVRRLDTTSLRRPSKTFEPIQVGPRDVIKLFSKIFQNEFQTTIVN